MRPQSKIIIFCGKGGVGKTTLSLALGLKHAALGRKVVLVSSHPLPELALAFSLEGLSEEWPAAAKNFFIVYLDAKELLAEVVVNNFPVQWVARAVLQSDIYRNLVEVAPGLKEFYFLARLQQLAERKRVASETVPDYDLLLWDAPATGHFLSTLRAARSFEVYLSGPLASAGADLNRFFSNPANIAVLPITTLEEMAIEETVEMCRALDEEFQLHAATVLLNLVSPITSASLDSVEEVRRIALAASNAALSFAVERGLLERERAAGLRDTLDIPTVEVERIRNTQRDLDLIEQAGRYLEAIAV
jgi:anion-transporting  ArsA/GET3 family ATPase